MDRKIKRHQISEQFIFSWIPDKNTARTLIAFVIFSCVIHFIGFYLFQVDYPHAELPELKSARITLLDPSNEEVKVFLQRVNDRVVYLEPPSKNSISRIKLSDHTIRFVPSFAEAKPTLREAVANFKYPIPTQPLRTDIENWNNKVNFSPNLLKRGIAPNTILDDYLSLIQNIPKIRVYLDVKPDGTPIDVYIAENLANENTRKLAKDIESFLRFNPTDKSRGIEPGWIDLGSESE